MAGTTEETRGPAADRRRWRVARRRLGPIGIVRAAAARLSALFLRIAHGGSGPVRLGVGFGVAAIWLAFSIPAALRIAFETGQASPLAGFVSAEAAKRAADFLCLVRSGERCKVEADDLGLIIGQTAVSLFALLAILFGFWTQVFAGLAAALRGVGAGHVLVVGAGALAETLARDVAKGGAAAVLVRPDADAADVATLGAAGVELVAGPPSDAEVLTRAGVRAAGKIVLMDDADTVNLGAAAVARAARPRRPGEVLVRVEKEDLRRDLALYGAADMFSVAELAARRLFLDASFCEWAVAAAQPRAHLVLFGRGAVAAAVAARAFRLLWAPGLEAPRVTVMTTSPDEDEAAFRAAYAAAFEAQAWRPDIVFAPFAWTSRADPAAALKTVRRARGAVTAALVSWPDDDDTLHCAALLARAPEIDSGALRLFVRESAAVRIADTLTRLGHRGVVGFADPVALAARRTIVDRAIDRAAERVHEHYLCTCVLDQNEAEYHATLRRGWTLRQRLALTLRPLEAEAPPEQAFSARFGDAARTRLRAALTARLLARGKFTPNEKRPAQRPWSELADHYVSANRTAADHAPIKLAALGWRPAEGGARGETPKIDLAAIDDALCELEHKRWLADYAMTGWRLGARNDDTMRHPDLQPYEAFDADKIALAKVKDRDNWLAAADVASDGGRVRFVRTRI
ncbi:MAG: NAD-binding protein [Alphaproteobacteria bacterium]|nr:NAD-binding protein [Alphaproteobacteria bacterium]